MSVRRRGTKDASQRAGGRSDGGDSVDAEDGDASICLVCKTGKSSVRW